MGAMWIVSLPTMMIARVIKDRKRGDCHDVTSEWLVAYEVDVRVRIVFAHEHRRRIIYGQYRASMGVFL